LTSSADQESLRWMAPRMVVLAGLGAVALYLVLAIVPACIAAAIAHHFVLRISTWWAMSCLLLAGAIIGLYRLMARSTLRLNSGGVKTGFFHRAIRADDVDSIVLVSCGTSRVLEFRAGSRVVRRVAGCLLPSTALTEFAMKSYMALSYEAVMTASEVVGIAPDGSNPGLIARIRVEPTPATVNAFLVSRGPIVSDIGRTHVGKWSVEDRISTISIPSLVSFNRRTDHLLFEARACIAISVVSLDK
jgi:hypothetical protein